MSLRMSRFRMRHHRQHNRQWAQPRNRQSDSGKRLRSTAHILRKDPRVSLDVEHGTQQPIQHVKWEGILSKHAEDMLISTEGCFQVQNNALAMGSSIAKSI